MDARSAGFTFIEVLMAMVLLGFALLGAQAVITDRLVNNVGRENSRATALSLVEDRLQLVQTAPEYSALEDRFEGTEADLPHFDGYVRETAVQRNADHTIVTVRVITPTADTLSGTAIVGVQ